MAIVLVQTQSAVDASASSRTATWVSNTTTSNLIVVALYTGFQAFSVVSTITDSQSNTYTKIHGGATGNDDAELWYASNITGGTTPTVTVTFTGTQSCNFIMREYSGIATTTPLDKQVIGTASTISPASSGATAATTQATELVIGWGVGSSSSSGMAAGSGYLDYVQASGGAGTIALEDKIVAATGAQTATMSMAVAINCIVGVATFKALTAAPILDATSSTTNLAAQTAGNTTTISHTCTGTSRVLIVSISAWNNGGTGTGCSGVTYGGTAMTAVGNGISNGAFYTEQWRLVAPATGANNIVATVSGKTDKLGLSGVSFTGADQTTGVEASTNAIGTVAAVTASLNSVGADYLVDCVSHLSANSPTSGTGTQIYSDAANGVSTVSQYSLAAAAGSNSQTWTYPDPGDAWAYSVLAVKPAGAGGGGAGSAGHNLTLLGVGK